MSKIVISKDELPIPTEDFINKIRFRVVNDNRNIFSDWSVINFVKQNELRQISQDGLPTGGNIGDIPIKLSNDNYDVGWSPLDQQITNVVDTTYIDSNLPSDVIRDTDNALLPNGGTIGQVLTKQSEADYDVDWQDPTGSGGAANPQDGNLIIGLSMFA